MNSTVIPIVSLSSSDIDLLNKCVWKSIAFFAKMSNTSQIVNGHVFYQCIFGWKRGTDIILNVRSFRYSELLELYTHLVTTYGLSTQLPPFPPKHMWGNTYKSVIDNRIKAFDPIFRRINSIPDINNDANLSKFFNVELGDNKVNPDGHLTVVDISKFVIGDSAYD